MERKKGKKIKETEILRKTERQLEKERQRKK